jgi:hypothetical protein
MKFNRPDIARYVPSLGAGRLLFGLWLAVAGSQAFAQSIQFSGVTIPNGEYNLTAVAAGSSINIYYAGEIDINVTQFNGINVSPYITVPTFCIQLDQDVNVGGSYTTYVVESLGSDSILTATAARDLATLYYLFFQGNSTSNWNATTGAAFQLDCWKIVQDPGNYDLTGSGNFYITSSGTEVSLAQNWLTTVSGTVVSSGGTNQPFALADPTYQDLLFTQGAKNELIPFGIQAWPGALLVGAVALLRVQRRLKAGG